MRKWLILLLVLTSTTLSAVEQTPDQIKTYAAQTFTANGAGQITGPQLGTVITNIADSFYSKTQALPVAAVPDFIQTDLLSVTVDNVIPALTRTPNGRMTLLLVNGQMLVSKGAAPPFSVAGATITWSAANAGYSVTSSDVIVAIYTHD